MKQVFYCLAIALFICKLCSSQAMNCCNGNWSGEYKVIASDGKQTTYKVYLQFTDVEGNRLKSSVYLRDLKDSLILADNNFYLDYLSGGSYSMVAGFAARTPNGIVCNGTMTYRFNGNNLLKLYGEFVPEKRGCIIASMVLNRIMGNPFIDASFPVNQHATLLDANELDDFHEGLAIIRKGESFAVIDQAGKQIIPWGKYKFNRKGSYEIDREICGFKNSCAAVRDPVTELYGFIDNTGKLIVSCILSEITPFREDEIMSKLNVLIVEDKFLTFRRLTKFFKDLGFNVLLESKNKAVDNYDDAVRLIKDTPQTLQYWIYR